MFEEFNIFFCFSGGVLLSYFTIQKMYVGVILTYSFLFGTGVGLGFSVTLAVAATVKYLKLLYLNSFETMIIINLFKRIYIMFIIFSAIL